MDNKSRKMKTISYEEFKKSLYLTAEDLKDIEAKKKLYETMFTIREKRKELGLTQVQLAEKAGLPRGTVNRIETGLRNVTMENFMKLAIAMGLEVRVG